MTADRLSSWTARLSAPSRRLLFLHRGCRMVRRRRAETALTVGIDLDRRPSAAMIRLL
jgi:hypothetical protein